MKLRCQTGNRRILIIGGTGSLGQTLIKRFLGHGRTNSVFVYSRDEAKHLTLRNQFGIDPMLNSSDLHFIVGDIRDERRLSHVLRRTRPNCIIMAAALKQVDTCERAPEESIQTNLNGIQNVLKVVDDCQNASDWLETVLLVSTDKACEPINVYGMCKAISERLVTSRFTDESSTKFVAVRYGNVLESRGSIIPLFKWQAENENFFSVTHAEMTRFIMTLEESVDLIENAIGPYAKNGQILLPKLPAMRIMDLARIFSEQYSKPIEIVGIRPGEKMHESLIGVSESLRALEGDDFFVLDSALSPIEPKARMLSYTSADSLLTKDALKTRLEELGILKAALKDFTVGSKIDEVKPLKLKRKR